MKILEGIVWGVFCSAALLSAMQDDVTMTVFFTGILIAWTIDTKESK